MKDSQYPRVVKPMPEKPAKAISPIPGTLDKNYLFSRIAVIIEKRRNRAITCANSEMAEMFRDIRHFINTTILGDNRVEYGRPIFPAPSSKLTGSDYV
jgi:hypothetical protein